MIKHTHITKLQKKYGISRVDKDFYDTLDSCISDIVEQTIKILSVNYPKKLITSDMLRELVSTLLFMDINEISEEDLDEMLLEIKGDDDE